jgi:cytoskeletal protein CcmA (bactofilin family)
MKNDTAAPPQTERRTVAWIGKGVRIEGKVISKEDLVIDGQVDGSIEVSDHNLSIGASGAIRADLFARRIVISGAVTGNVKALERVDLQATGSVTGDITAPKFVMAEGAAVAGRVDAGASRGNGVR